MKMQLKSKYSSPWDIPTREVPNLSEELWPKTPPATQQDNDRMQDSRETDGTGEEDNRKVARAFL